MSKKSDHNIENRKGARKADDIPNAVLNLLNNGKIATVNLTEWLAVDQTKLIKNTFSDLGLKSAQSNILKAIAEQKKPSTMKLIKLVGQELFAHCDEQQNLEPTIKTLSTQKSDTLRCYACYLIALNPKLKIGDKLKNSKNLIADKHFGVREIVWMALRPDIENNLKFSISLFKKWAKDPDENIRRFTTESIRPRGVWCKHIESMKEDPSQALPILEILKSDESKYVRDSVSNWLNDASKSQPEFVIQLCEKWSRKSPTDETNKIIKRALRTVQKK